MWVLKEKVKLQEICQRNRCAILQKKKRKKQKDLQMLNKNLIRKF